MMGTGVALLVPVTMSITYVLHRRRRDPNATYSTKYERRLTAEQYLRRLGALALVLADMGVQRFDSSSVAGSQTYQSVYNEVLRAGHGSADADLLASGASSGYTVITEE